jgi:lysophospholipid acyltransferase (LPLAT)-like uncharacterized protein
MSRARFPWWLGIVAEAGAGLLLALGGTWRIRPVRLHERDARLDRGERCIFAFWHARLLPLVYTHRRRSIVVLISQHRDGELIARVIHRLGYLTSRGSSTRGGWAWPPMARAVPPNRSSPDSCTSPAAPASRSCR